MKQRIKIALSRVIKFCPKTGRPVKALKKWIIPFFSVLSLIWILIRVLPKPQRATYPCMKVAIPMASSLLIYLSSLTVSVVVFKKAFRKMADARYVMAGLLLLVASTFALTGVLVNKNDLFASESIVAEFEDPLGPNVPIGEAKGIIPGRVVWMHNPDATNENCVPWEWGDGYFLDKNCDQELVDEMMISAILEVSGEETEEEAWTSVFKYFNSTHDKGDVGYAAGEKIFIKINAVHAWNTYSDLSIMDDDAYGNVDTSPQVILAVLRQLVLKAGVAEDAIYIGDPFTNVFKHLYDKLAAEFPGIHYMSQGDYDNRDKLQFTNSENISFSDRGTVLDVENDQYYDCVINADYVLSLPAMKGHRGGGVTFFAKNHFGTNNKETAAHMHKGLHKGTSDPLRGDYKEYRVFVDLMSYKHLGGKTLIYIGDFLWGTSMEHDPPVKFLTAPFNNDYTSSILVSLDPVAIASVALDIYQEEFQVEDKSVYPPRNTYVRFSAVDDYMHQAASSDWWPDGISYDPENDGTVIGSLGVHEHWNNATEKEYSRNLGTGEGIELVYQNTQKSTTAIEERIDAKELFRTYLSGENTLLNLVFQEAMPEEISVKIFTVSGQLVQQEILNYSDPGAPVQIRLEVHKSAYYIVHVHSGHIAASQGFIIP
jgi:hypothetical protein